MCRNIRTLANFEPPASDHEVRAAALQFVRKVSGTAHPSRANEAAFNQAVDDVALVVQRLLASLETRAAPRDRDVEARKAKERARKRFAADRSEGAPTADASAADVSADGASSADVTSAHA